MRKRMLTIAIICLIIAAVISIYGICYAGPECKTYGLRAENGEHWQLRFECQSPDGFIGVVSFITNGNIMARLVYLFFYDTTNSEMVVYIPNVCGLVYTDSALIYKEFNMIFKKE